MKDYLFGLFTWLLPAIMFIYVMFFGYPPLWVGIVLIAMAGIAMLKVRC